MDERGASTPSLSIHASAASPCLSANRPRPPLLPTGHPCPPASWKKGSLWPRSSCPLHPAWPTELPPLGSGLWPVLITPVLAPELVPELWQVGRGALEQDPPYETAEDGGLQQGVTKKTVKSSRQMGRNRLWLPVPVSVQGHQEEPEQAVDGRGPPDAGHDAHGLWPLWVSDGEAPVGHRAVT